MLTRRNRHARLIQMLILIAVLPLAADGCDSVPSLQATAVALQHDRIIIFYIPCSPERVEAVGLGQRSRPHTLWRISSHPGQIHRHFVVGRAPTGFSTDVPLRHRIPRHGTLDAFVRTDRASASFGFSYRRLDQGKLLLIDGRHILPSEFSQERQDAC